MWEIKFEKQKKDDFSTIIPREIDSLKYLYITQVFNST